MPGEVRFAIVRSLLEKEGWRLARVNGSHHVFSKEERGVIVVPVHNGKVKPVYVRQIQKKLEDG